MRATRCASRLRLKSVAATVCRAPRVKAEVTIAAMDTRESASGTRRRSGAARRTTRRPSRSSARPLATSSAPRRATAPNSRLRNPAQLRAKKRTVCAATATAVTESTTPGEARRPRRWKSQRIGPDRSSSSTEATAAKAKGARKIASAARDFEWKVRWTVYETGYSGPRAMATPIASAARPAARSGSRANHRRGPARSHPATRQSQGTVRAE
ncbi:MAG: hypothetical protein IPN17_05425 [Deltaproteobacteria bacterium]|nr:hypothetical protein [Deltaproteobacteria bacterium]